MPDPIFDVHMNSCKYMDMFFKRTEYIICYNECCSNAFSAKEACCKDDNPIDPNSFIKDYWIALLGMFIIVSPCCVVPFVICIFYSIKRCFKREKPKHSTFV